MKQCFAHPRPDRPRPSILPIFLPQAGCGERCVFCDQQAQTGQANAPLESVLRAADVALHRTAESGRAPVEVGFYGGTFTRLPVAAQLACLELAASHAARGTVSGVRCSTRPDALDPAGLDRLGRLGLGFVELGVQSFQNEALHKSRRGYDGQSALAGCRTVQEAGLGLGVHLMPGLPGLDRAGFARDVAELVRIRPDSVRLHPLVVLANTLLAAQTAAGEYTPLELDETLEMLGHALVRLWEAGIAVARVGVAPEQDFVSATVAGPWHPSLGQRAASRALLAVVRARLQACAGRVDEIMVPHRHASEFWGWKGEMESSYRRLGLTRGNVTIWEENFFLLRGPEAFTIPGETNPETPRTLP